MEDKGRRGRRDSAAAKHLDGLFEEMRSSEAKSFLLPIIKHMRASHGTKDADNSNEVTKRDLQQLAVAWKLTQMPDFWKQYPTVDDLLRVLHKHAKKLRESNTAAPHMEVLSAQPSKSKVKPVATTTSQRHPEDWRRTLTRLASTFGISAYAGDLFGTRGDYDDGLIYLSRAPIDSASGEFGAHSAATGVTATADADKTHNHDDATPRDAFLGYEDASNSHAFEALRLTSTGTLVEISANEELREEIAEPMAVQILFDTWRSSTHPQIRRNCALTIANLFSTVEMYHDDLMLPILGICTAESTVGELGACTRALTCRALLPRPIDVLFVPSLLTAVMSIIRRDGITALVKSECVLIMLQILESSVDNGGQGAPENLVEAVNALVTGGLSSIAAPPPKSPRKDGSPTASKAPDSPRKIRQNKSLARMPTFKNAVITPLATAAAQQAAKTLASRPSFRLTAVLSGVASAEAFEAQTTSMPDYKADLVTPLEADEDMVEVLTSREAGQSIATARQDLTLTTTRVISPADTQLATRLALEYGLLALLVTIAKSCQDGLALLGVVGGAIESAIPRRAAPSVPFADGVSAQMRPQPCIDAPDAVYLTDALEYCVACYIRIARLPGVVGDLAAKSVVASLVSLLQMRRTCIRDGASRVLYALCASDDAGVYHELAVPEYVQSLSRTAWIQAQENHTSPPPEDCYQSSGSREELLVAPLAQTVCRGLLSLSSSSFLASLLVSAKAGDALMLFYQGTDAAARRWALLALCNLFELSEAGREDLLKLGFLPVMINSVKEATAAAKVGKASKAELFASVRHSPASDPEAADRFSGVDATTSCALAVCALCAGAANVTSQLLDHGVVDMLHDFLMAAKKLVRDGVCGLGALNALPSRGKRGVSAVNETSGSTGAQEDESFVGMPSVYHPKVVAAAVRAIASLAMNNDGAAALLVGPEGFLSTLICCVPPKPFLTHGNQPIPRHVTDAALGDWAAAEKGIQVAAAEAVCFLCAYPQAQMVFAAHGDHFPSALELLCRIAGTEPPSSIATTGGAETSLKSPPPAPMQSPSGAKPPMARQNSVRLVRAATLTEDSLSEQSKTESKERPRERPKPFIWEAGIKDRCLYNITVMSAHAEAHSALIRLGCLPLLISHIRHVHSRMRKQCAHAIYNFTCTAIDAPDGRPTSRVRQLIEADLAAALTIGSLFRADDDTTRDLCAAAMYNVLSITFILADRMGSAMQAAARPSSSLTTVAGEHTAAPTASSSSLTIQVTDKAAYDPAEQLHIVTDLRGRLLKDGLLWAIIKLAQGLKSASGTASSSHRPAKRSSLSILPLKDLTKLLQGRYMTTAALMRNLAADPTTCIEVSRRHSVYMLNWYAKQCAQVLGVEPHNQKVAVKLAAKMPEQARRALLASFSVMSEDESASNSIGKSEAGGPDVAIVPVLLLTCSQISCLLASNVVSIRQLVPNGFLVALARVVDIVFSILGQDGALPEPNISSSFAVTLSVLHRVAVTFFKVTTDLASAYGMLSQGPLCVGLLHAMFTCIEKAYNTLHRASRTAIDMHIDASSDISHPALLPLTYRHALLNCAATCGAALTHLSSITEPTNLLATQGFLELCMRLCDFATRSDAHMDQLLDDTISIGPQSEDPRLTIRVFLIDSCCRSVFNIIGNKNNAALAMLRRDAAFPASLGAEEAIMGYSSVDASAKNLCMQLLHAIDMVGSNSESPLSPFEAVCHAQRVTCVASVLTRLASEDVESLPPLDLHDPRLLSKLVEVAEFAQTNQVIEASALAVCNICCLAPARYVPRSVLQFLVDSLASSQFLPSGTLPAVGPLTKQSSGFRASKRATLLVMGSASPVRTADKSREVAPPDARRQLLQLNYSTASCIVRCLSVLLKTKPTLESKPTEAQDVDSQRWSDARPALITHESHAADDNHTELCRTSTPNDPKTSVGADEPVGSTYGIRRSSSFGAEPAAAPLASLVTASHATKSQVSQASLLALKSLIDREHEDAARRARTTESPHLRPLVEFGVVEALAAVSIHSRALLKARGSVHRQLRASATTESALSPPHKDKPRPGSAWLEKPSSKSNERAHHSSLTNIDRDVGRFIAVLQYLCADCLLTVSRSPDAKGCMLGMELQGPRPLMLAEPVTYMDGGATVDTAVKCRSEYRTPAVRLLGMRANCGMEALSAVAKSGRTILQRIAAEAMAYLTQTHSLRVQFLQAKAASVLASLARQSTSDHQTQKWCTVGLKNLSDDAKLRSSILEAGGMVQGALMLLPNAEDDESRMEDNGLGMNASKSPRRKTREPSTAESPAGQTAGFAYVGTGLELRRVLEVENGMEEEDGMWSEDDMDDIEPLDLDRAGSVTPASDTVHLEQQLQLSLFRLPRSWLPGETPAASDCTFPSILDLSSLRDISGSGCMPDKDSGKDWGINDALMGAPEKVDLSGAFTQPPEHVQDDEQVNPLPTDHIESTTSPTKWTDMVAYRAGALSEDSAKQSLGIQLMQSLESLNIARKEGSRLPDSAFKHRVHFEKSRAYDRELPIAVIAHTVPDASSSLLATELGMTDAVAKELAATVSPALHMLTPEESAKKAMAVLKPFLLPDQELKQILMVPNAKDDYEEDSLIAGRAESEVSGFLVSPAAFELLSGTREIQSPGFAAQSPLARVPSLDPRTRSTFVDTKDSSVVHLPGRLDGAKFVSRPDSDFSASGRRGFRTLNDPWRDPEDDRPDKSQGSIFDRLTARQLESRNAHRMSTSRSNSSIPRHGDPTKLPELFQNTSRTRQGDGHTHSTAATSLRPSTKTSLPRMM